MTSNSDGTSKKGFFDRVSLSPFDLLFLFQFLDLTSISQKISVRIRLESAAVYHHDPNSVRT